MKGIRAAVGLAALSVGISSAMPAHAGEDYGGPGLIVAFLDVPAVLLSITPDVVNLVHIAGVYRGPVGWSVVGYFLGALTIAAGALTVSAYSGADSPGSGYAMGGVTIGLGAVGIGLGVWNQVLPVRLAPVVARDVRGAPVVGAGLVLTSF
jgi:hypothetical protein